MEDPNLRGALVPSLINLLRVYGKEIGYDSLGSRDLAGFGLGEVEDLGQSGVHATRTNLLLLGSQS